MKEIPYQKDDLVTNALYRAICYNKLQSGIDYIHEKHDQHDNIEELVQRLDDLWWDIQGGYRGSHKDASEMDIMIEKFKLSCDFEDYFDPRVALSMLGLKENYYKAVLEHLYSIRSELVDQINTGN